MTDNNDLYELEPISDETTLCTVEPIENDQSSFAVEIAKDIAMGLAYGAAIIGGQLAFTWLVNSVSDFKEARKLRKARDAESVSDETKPENPEDDTVVINNQNQ